MGLNLLPTGLDEFNIDSDINADETPPIDAAGGEAPVKPAASNQKYLRGQGYTYTVDVEKKVASVWLISDIWYDVSIYLKMLNLIAALTEEYTFHVYIHSPGGILPVACHILSALLKCRATVITHNLGMAASCGSLILSGGSKIAIHPNSITMFHGSASGGYDMSHRLYSRTGHTLKFVEYMLNRMVVQGLVTNEEYDGITKRGEEFYLTSDTMITRLKANNLLYEDI